ALRDPGVQSLGSRRPEERYRRGIATVRVERVAGDAWRRHERQPRCDRRIRCQPSPPPVAGLPRRPRHAAARDIHRSRGHDVRRRGQAHQPDHARASGEIRPGVRTVDRTSPGTLRRTPMTESWATVFVVDDDPALRTSLETLLGTAGLQAETFASGREFFDAYAPDRPGCLVLDLRLRGESGMDVLDRLRAEDTALPVIMLTAHGDVPTSVHALKGGAIDFLEKPVRPTVLIARIREALELDRSSRETRAAASAVEELAKRPAPRERPIAPPPMAGERSK